MTNKSIIRDEVLGSAVEDYHGLWEIIWGLRPLLPDTTEAELASLAEREIRELLAEGKVALFRRRGVLGEELVRDPVEVEAALSNQGNWIEPLDAESIQILVGATDKGENDYYSHKTD